MSAAIYELLSQSQPGLRQMGNMQHVYWVPSAFLFYLIDSENDFLLRSFIINIDPCPRINRTGKMWMGQVSLVQSIPGLFNPLPDDKILD